MHLLVQRRLVVEQQLKLRNFLLDKFLELLQLRVLNGLLLVILNLLNFHLKLSNLFFFLFDLLNQHLDLLQGPLGVGISDPHL